jgi:hypothetical protein
MNVPLRVLACAVVLFGAVLFVGCVLVPWMGGPSLFPHDLHELGQQFFDEHQRRETLDVYDRALVDDLESKREVVASVIAGRTSLAAATGEFRRLRERLMAAQDEDGTLRVPEADDEGLARQVIAWVMVATRDDPRRHEVLDRLEAELDALRSRQR